MARLKKNKKPLRGSIRQNLSREGDREKFWACLFGFWPRLALLVLGSISLIVFLAWLLRDPWPRAQWARAEAFTLRMTGTIGFSVRDVIVEGRTHTDKQALLNALDVATGTPILAFDPRAAHEKIMALPWTKEVVILRSLPNRIVVRLTERKPVARWQNGGRTIVIDENGNEVKAASADQFSDLPLVVGNAAPEQTQALFSLLSAFPVVAPRFKAAVRVSGRRWDIHLHPDTTVRLPERNADVALARLTTLIQDGKIETTGVQSIDLRLPERVFVEPVPDPAAPEHREFTE